MLFSMTGQGQARRQADDLLVTAEVRSVNNRFLKVSVNSSDRTADLEAKVKSQVQQSVRRGSVYVQIELQQQNSPSAYQLNKEVLQSYMEQLSELDPNVTVSQCLDLPGVVDDNNTQLDAETIWNEVEPALQEALDSLIEMRKREGASMAADLQRHCDQITEHLDVIKQRSPDIAKDYSKRLTERINALLADFEVSISASDVVKEVGIFADRCDISEEIVRLETHLEQFVAIVNSSQSDGRKLEFLTQELLRETNTIGSKANDADIAKHVVDIKTAIERIREMTQNIE